MQSTDSKKRISILVLAALVLVVVPHVDVLAFDQCSTSNLESLVFCQNSQSDESSDDHPLGEHCQMCTTFHAAALAVSANLPIGDMVIGNVYNSEQFLVLPPTFSIYHPPE